MPATLRGRVLAFTLSVFRRVTATASEDFVDTARQAAESLEHALAVQGLSVAGFRQVLVFGSIDWASADVARVTFRHLDAEPPLPFADGHFDGVWSIDAFTRLPGESAARWLTQLRRILRRGGIALVAVQGLFRFNEDVARGCIRPDAVREFDRDGFTYVHAGSDRRLPDWYEHAFMTEDYARGLFGQYFDVLDYLPRGMMQRQDLLVLRRR